MRLCWDPTVHPGLPVPDTRLESKQGESMRKWWKHYRSCHSRPRPRWGSSGSPDVSRRSKFGTIIDSGDRDRKDALASETSSNCGAKTLLILLTSFDSEWNPPTPLWRWRRAYWGANSHTKCSMTFVHIAVAISALAGEGPFKISHRVHILLVFS